MWNPRPFNWRKRVCIKLSVSSRSIIFMTSRIHIWFITCTKHWKPTIRWPTMWNMWFKTMRSSSLISLRVVWWRVVSIQMVYTKRLKPKKMYQLNKKHRPWRRLPIRISSDCIQNSVGWRVRLKPKKKNSWPSITCVSWRFRRIVRLCVKIIRMRFMEHKKRSSKLWWKKSRSVMPQVNPCWLGLLQLRPVNSFRRCWRRIKSAMKSWMPRTMRVKLKSLPKPVRRVRSPSLPTWRVVVPISNWVKAFVNWVAWLF